MQFSCVFRKAFSLNKYEGKGNTDFYITSVIGNEQCLQKKG